MRPGLLSLAGFGCAAFAAGLGLLSTSGELAATSSGLTALVNTDGNLLDDALELRLGTDPLEADSDLDGRTDLEEILLLSDPNLHQIPGNLPAPCTTLDLQVYQVEQDFVFELYALTVNGVQAVEIHQALLDQNQIYYWRDLYPYVVDTVLVPSTMTGYDIQRSRLRVNSAWFDQHPSVAFGVKALVDQLVLADSVQLTHSDGYLAEVNLRFNQASTRGSGPGISAASASLANGEVASSGGGEKTGGLFPVDPGSGGQTNGTPDEICLQTLVPIANLGNGRVQYVVADAGCATEPGSVCMPGCSFTKDDTIVGINVIGLLGG